MRSEILLLAEISFLDKAKESFNFPIFNSIRTSLWLLHAEYSTFSEIVVEPGSFLEIGRLHKVRIKLPESSFLMEKLYPDVEIKLGVFPVEIANGKILEVYH